MSSGQIRESNAEKQSTGSGPEGYDENGLAWGKVLACRRFGALEVRLPLDTYYDRQVSTKLMTLFKRPHADTPIRRYASPMPAHFDRNKVHVISGTGH
jgi:hypothetical protein